MADWQKVELGNTWNYKAEGEGAEFSGIYNRKEEHVGENDSIVYTFLSDGNLVTVWGSTVLDARMLAVKIGEEVKIIYLGVKDSEKRKGKIYHAFEVYHREVPMTEVN